MELHFGVKCPFKFDFILTMLSLKYRIFYFNNKCGIFVTYRKIFANLRLKSDWPFSRFLGAKTTRRLAVWVCSAHDSRVFSWMLYRASLVVFRVYWHKRETWIPRVLESSFLSSLLLHSSIFIIPLFLAIRPDLSPLPVSTLSFALNCDKEPRRKLWHVRAFCAAAVQGLSHCDTFTNVAALCK